MSLFELADDVCPADVEHRKFLCQSFGNAIEKPMPSLTVEQFANAVNAEVCRASGEAVGQTLKKMGYKALGYGLHIHQTKPCVRVSDHHIRIWDPREENSVRQTHRQFLALPEAFFTLPHAVKVLERSEIYFQLPLPE